MRKFNSHRGFEMRRWQPILFALFVQTLPSIVGVRGQAAPADDPVSRLAESLNGGLRTFPFDERTGYLRSVLNALEIPISSQTLVFARNSLMRQYISPRTPRAIYFNDQTYVAYSVGAPSIELARIDAGQRLQFYSVEQAADRARITRDDTHACEHCHEALSSHSRLLMRSNVTDRDGNVLQSSTMRGLQFTMSDRTPFTQRWGGWYVTGTHGASLHRGNVYARGLIEQLGNPEQYTERVDWSRGANVSSVRDQIASNMYLTDESDIVALTVLGHQVDVANDILSVGTAGTEGRDVNAEIERLVSALLFVGEAPLPSPIVGTTTFAADFAARGPRDHLGRSLRECDLRRRLARYPLSYLIYSEPFERLPTPIKAQVYQRLKDVLTGKDHSVRFAHLSAEDRTAILDILHETKPDFPR